MCRGERAAHWENPQVLLGTPLPALLLGVQEKGRLGFVRDRIPIDLVKKLCSSLQQDEIAYRQEQGEVIEKRRPSVVGLLYAVGGERW